MWKSALILLGRGEGGVEGGGDEATAWMGPRNEESLNVVGGRGEEEAISTHREECRRPLGDQGRGGVRATTHRPNY
jgi:hypothetical protein